MSRWALAGSLLLAACGSTSGQSPPTVQSFIATPALLVGDGGVVELRWSVSGADSVTIAPGVGPVTPPSGGTVSPHVSGTTSFSLTATGPGGNATSTAQVRVCDPAPANMAGTCAIASAGQCIDFSGLGSSDRDSLVAYCTQLGGAWGTAACPTANRVGTCQTPPLGPGTGISCSANAIILERYYPPNYSASTAQSVCATVSGSAFTPG